MKPLRYHASSGVSPTIGTGLTRCGINYHLDGRGVVGSMRGCTVVSRNALDVPHIQRLACKKCMKPDVVGRC